MHPKIAHHPGYVGAFTRHQAEGAIRNGASVVKVKSEPGDGTPNGTSGRVLGSIDGALYMSAEALATFNGARIMYWVEWSNAPKHAVAIVDWKIKEAT